MRDLLLADIVSAYGDNVCQTNSSDFPGYQRALFARKISDQDRELEKYCSTGFVLMSKQMEIQTPLAFYDKDTVGKLSPQVNNWKSQIQLSLVQMYVGWNPLEW